MCQQESLFGLPQLNWVFCLLQPRFLINTRPDLGKVYLQRSRHPFKKERKQRKGKILWASWDLDSYQATNLCISHGLYFKCVYSISFCFIASFLCPLYTDFIAITSISRVYITSKPISINITDIVLVANVKFPKEKSDGLGFGWISTCGLTSNVQRQWSWNL